MWLLRRPRSVRNQTVHTWKTKRDCPSLGSLRTTRASRELKVGFQGSRYDGLWVHILPIGFLSGQERRLGPNDQGNKHRLIKLLLVWLLLVTVEKCKGSTGICPKGGGQGIASNLDPQRPASSSSPATLYAGRLHAWQVQWGLLIRDSSKFLLTVAISVSRAIR